MFALILIFSLPVLSLVLMGFDINNILFPSIITNIFVLFSTVLLLVLVLLLLLVLIFL